MTATPRRSSRTAAAAGAASGPGTGSGAARPRVGVPPSQRLGSTVAEDPPCPSADDFGAPERAAKPSPSRETVHLPSREPLRPETLTSMKHTLHLARAVAESNLPPPSQVPTRSVAPRRRCLQFSQSSLDADPLSRSLQSRLRRGLKPLGPHEILNNSDRSYYVGFSWSPSRRLAKQPQQWKPPCFESLLSFHLCFETSSLF